MKLLKSNFEIIPQKEGVVGIYKQVELAGRTCYKSEDKITPDSAKKFVDMMVRSGHGAMLEHGTVYLKMSYGLLDQMEDHNVTDYQNNKYSKVNRVYESPISAFYYVTTNLRVLVENDWLEEDWKYLCKPTKYHEKRVTVKFTCDRVTGESFLRHRAIDEDHPTIEGEVTRECERDIDSFARESTRFCNYSKEKFGKELSIIVPPEFSDEEIEVARDQWECSDGIFHEMCAYLGSGDDNVFGIIDTWLFANLATEWAYFNLLRLGQKPEQARRVLPLDIKSPLIMTGFVSDWEHFFGLRCAKDAHIQARELAVPLREEFVRRGLITDKTEE